ncbi:sodium/potassium/calcium exchanger 1 [Gracilaria domingensis]|nr:sodium/potassium/calcium exchanger 1 [Gracilaria domingensis]
MTSVHPSLTSVTAMTLRTSFATAMLHDYRRGKFTKDGQEMNEDKFLGLVAKQMNTSVEQLRGTYMASRSSDFKEVTAIMTKHFCMILGEDSDDEDGSGGSDSENDLSDSQRGTERGSVEDESSDDEEEEEIGTGVRNGGRKAELLTENVQVAVVAAELRKIVEMS